MQSFGGTNIHILDNSSVEDTIKYLKAVGVIGPIPRPVHMTNGTYVLPEDKIVPTTLAGYAYINQKVGFLANDVIMIAFNSDQSMRNAHAKKTNEKELNDALEPETARAKKVLNPLGEYFVARTIIGVFYDEDTPLELFTALKRSGLKIATHHKHGYGTNPNDKPIIGAGLCGRVFAFPLLNDEKPVVHADTRMRNATDVYPNPEDVVKLWEAKSPLGTPYLTTEGKINFPVPNSLARFAALGPDQDPKFRR